MHPKRLIAQVQQHGYKYEYKALCRSINFYISSDAIGNNLSMSTNPQGANTGTSLECKLV